MGVFYLRQACLQKQRQRRLGRARRGLLLPLHPQPQKLCLGHAQTVCGLVVCIKICSFADFDSLLKLFYLVIENTVFVLLKQRALK